MPKYRIKPGYRGAGQIKDYTEAEAASWPDRLERVADDVAVAPTRPEPKAVVSDEQLLQLGDQAEQAPAKPVGHEDKPQTGQDAGQDNEPSGLGTAVDTVNDVQPRPFTPLVTPAVSPTAPVSDKRKK